MNPARLLVQLGTHGKLETRTGRVLVIFLLVFAVFHFTGPFRVLADHGEVVVIGSAGTVDEDSLSKYEVRGQFATIKNTETGTVTYRYQLPAVDNFDDDLSMNGFRAFIYGNGSGYKTIRIRYRDGGASQNVQVRLRAATLGMDGVSTIWQFDSDTGSTTGGTPVPPNVNANQTFDECFVELPVGHILHGRYGYFLEVAVTRTSNEGRPDNLQTPGFIAFVASNDGIDDVTCSSVMPR